MGATDVSRWLHEYLEVFASCGRGDSDPAALLDYYAVPLLLSMEDTSAPLLTEDEVRSMAQRQVDGMRAADYHHSDILELTVCPMNRTSAVCRGSFVRRGRDGTELGRLTVSYLVTGARSWRISALIVHSSSME